MITEISRERLVEVGSRFRANYLVEQAGYTLGIATLDGQALYDLLPEGFISEVKEVRKKVDEARKDKALMEAESKEATKEQNKAFKLAKIWRRKVAKRAKNAAEMGKSIPKELIVISYARTIAALQGQVAEMVKLLEENLSNLQGAGLDKLLDEGKKLEEALRETDAVQEMKRLKELPDRVSEFYYQKGLLYTGLKIINNAGHELHSDEPTLAAKYNLSILHRHGGKETTEETADIKDTKK